MTDKETSTLMLCCGALHDIAEKSNEMWTKKQITDVQKKIEKLIGFVESDNVINTIK